MCERFEHFGILLAFYSCDEQLSGGSAKGALLNSHARLDAQLTENVGGEYAPGGFGTVQQIDCRLKRRFIATPLKR